MAQVAELEDKASTPKSGGGGRPQWGNEAASTERGWGSGKGAEPGGKGGYGGSRRGQWGDNR